MKAMLRTLQYRNPSDSSMTMWLEPLGDLVEIPARVTVELEYDDFGESRLSAKVVEEPGRVTVYAFVTRIRIVDSSGTVRDLWPPVSPPSPRRLM